MEQITNTNVRLQGIYNNKKKKIIGNSVNGQGKGS